MSEIVVDASVAAKWFFTEPHSDLALRLLSGRAALVAPDLMPTEFANVVWKRHRRKEITAKEAGAIVGDFLRFPVQIIPSGKIVTVALDIAMSTSRTVYDSLYLALAIDRSCPFITGDEKFVNALSAGPFVHHIRWIGRRH